MQEYVLVPKRLIKELEKEREALYDISKDLSETLVNSNMTGIMWKVANTRWNEFNKTAYELMFEQFNKNYCKAVVTSDPQYYYHAALNARTIVDIMEKTGIIKDTWDTNYKEAQEEFGEDK